MKIFGMCMECMRELGRPYPETFYLPYFDDRQVEIKCSRGHTGVIVLQCQKFEVLLDSGADALSAGFTYEAAASFSSAIERFYEFCMKVICRHRGMDEVMFDQMFKVMANQSERQLGAFLSLYALEFGKAYTPKKDIVEFRNSVIHKGKIPRPEEVLSFCEKVYNEIFLLTMELERTCFTAIQRVVGQDLTQRASKLPKGTPTATTAGTRLFNLTNQSRKHSFSEAYEEFLNSREFEANLGPKWEAAVSALDGEIFPKG